MLSPLEEKILKKVAEAQLLTKFELKGFLKENGLKGTSQAIDVAVRSLNERDLLAVISPIGSTCYVVTKRGNKLLQDI